MFIAACVQLRSGSNISENIARTEHLVERAARAGARLVLTPENTTFLGPSDEKVALAEPLDGPTHQRLARLAAQHHIYLLVGSVAERLDDQRCYNTSVLYGPEGMIAFYRKIHLFDIDIPQGPRFTESATIAPGAAPVVAPTPFGPLGLSVCYDMRFPMLYQKLVEMGAMYLAIPSAFTLMTGKDHWHVLLRARAIEAQCFVFAPAQEGRHDPAGARHSYGHSLIIDPWGTVLADCGEGEGLALAEIDPRKVDAVRRAMPVQAHRRPLA